MEENRVFRYQYSAKQNKEVENIRKKYMPKEVSKLELLKKLDYRVQSAGIVQSLTIGVIGCLIFGVGMCFGLDVLLGPDWLSILLGIAGVCVMIPAYPVYRRIARKTKEALTPQILQLSEELMNDP